MGLRVVASDIPSHREIAESLDGLELVNAKNSEEVEDSINSAASSDSIAYRGIEKFEWSRVSERYLEEYRKILPDFLSP